MSARIFAPLVVLAAVGLAPAQQPARTMPLLSQQPHRPPYTGNGGFVWPPVRHPAPGWGWGFRPVPVVAPPVWLGRYYPPAYGYPGYGYGYPGYGYPPVYGYGGYGARW